MESSANCNDDCHESLPKAPKTSVSLLQEIAFAFKMGLPMYELVEKSNEPNENSAFFKMSLTVASLGLTEVGEAATKMQAKHNAADIAIDKIKQAAANGSNMNIISNDVLVKCVERLNMNSLIKKDLPELHTTNPTAKLKEWAFTNDNIPLDYEMISATGPSHDRTFVLRCNLKGFTTEGVGKSKKLAKSIAADRMLQIIQTPPNSRPSESEINP